MTYKGRVENGVIVLDEPADLPDGASVRIDVCAKSEQAGNETVPTLAEALAPFIGKAVGLPEDAAENHDHYLYGLPVTVHGVIPENTRGNVKIAEQKRD